MTQKTLRTFIDRQARHTRTPEGQKYNLDSTEPVITNYRHRNINFKDWKIKAH